MSRRLAALCAIVLFAAGCDPVDGPAVDSDPPADSGAGATQGKAVALRQLGALTVGTWATMTNYSRDRFPHWSSQGGGCDTRDVILKRDGKDVVATADCKITGGSWFSVYDGKTVTDPGTLDIDHMVPLANAWRTGAKEWSDQKRGEFANDMSGPQLIAVTASTNRSKGDQDPSEWQPPREAYWCVYAQQWVAVKTEWKLIVTAVEKEALGDMLGTCP